MPDPLTIYKKFSSSRREVPDRTAARAPSLSRGESRDALRPEVSSRGEGRREAEAPPRESTRPGEESRSGRSGAEELSLLCAGFVAVAAASFFLGWYSRGKTRKRSEPEPVAEKVQTWCIEDLQRALEPARVRYGLSAGVCETEREARHRASSFAKKGLKSRVLKKGGSFAVVVGEFDDPSRAAASPLREEIPGSRPVRLP